MKTEKFLKRRNGLMQYFGKKIGAFQLSLKKTHLCMHLFFLVLSERDSRFFRTLSRISGTIFFNSSRDRGSTFGSSLSSLLHKFLIHFKSALLADHLRQSILLSLKHLVIFWFYDKILLKYA